MQTFDLSVICNVLTTSHQNHPCNNFQCGTKIQQVRVESRGCAYAKSSLPAVKEFDLADQIFWLTVMKLDKNTSIFFCLMTPCSHLN